MDERMSLTILVIASRTCDSIFSATSSPLAGIKSLRVRYLAVFGPANNDFLASFLSLSRHVVTTRRRLWYFAFMRLFCCAMILALFCLACAADPDPELEDWRRVLAAKAAIDETSPAAAVPTRQKYIDTLREFCRRYPNHSRAREVYQAAELEYARE